MSEIKKGRMIQEGIREVELRGTDKRLKELEDKVILLTENQTVFSTKQEEIIVKQEALERKVSPVKEKQP